MNVDEMLDEITTAQFYEWMAYNRIEPFGPRADWIRHGDLMVLIASIHTSKNSKAPKREDFIPDGL